MSVVPRCIAGDFTGATDLNAEGVAPGILSRVDGPAKLNVDCTPTKEMPSHAAFCETRSTAGAVVHLYACPSAALSLMVRADRDNVLPPFRPCSIMRLGKADLLSNFPSGDPRDE